MYVFRFQVIENITGASSRITAAFGRMSSQARMFASNVHAGGNSINDLESEIKKLESAQKASTSTLQIRQYGTQIDALRGKIRGLKGETESTNSTIGRLNSTLGSVGSLAKGMLLGSVAAGMGAAVVGVGKYADRLYTANALTAGITRNTESLAKAQSVALGLSNKTGDSYLSTYEGLSKMLTITNGNVEKAGDLTKIASALAGINPAEGFEGALFALKEIEGGDTMSLRERFNIKVPTAKEAEKIAQKDGRTIQQVMFDSLQQQLDKSYGGGQKGAGVDFLLNVRANSITGQVNRVVNQFKNMFTPLIAEVAPKVTAVLSSISSWVTNNTESIKGYVNGVLSRLGAIFNLVAQVFRIAQPFLLAFGAGLYAIVQVGQTLLWNYLVPAASWILKHTELIQGLGLVIGSVVLATWAWNNASLLFSGIAAFSTAITTGFSGAVAALNASLLANPIAWVVGLVAALVVSLTYAWNNFDGFRGAVVGMWSVIKEFGSVIYDYMIAPLLSLGKVLVGVFTFDSSLITEGIQDGIAAANKIMQGPTLASRIGGAFGKGYADGVANTTKIDPLGFYKPDDQNVPAAKKDAPTKSIFDQLGITPSTNANKDLKSGNLGVSNKIDSISGGREGIKNITYNIRSLVENMVFQESKGLPEVKTIIRREVEGTLLSIANDSNHGT